MITLGCSALCVLTITLYATSLLCLSLYGLHRYWIVYLYSRQKGSSLPFPTKSPLFREVGLKQDLYGVSFRRAARFTPPHTDPVSTPPHVTVQLPIYNEMYVVERLIESVCAFDYPKDKLQIQVLDDSTDETVEIAAKKVQEMKKRGFDIVHIRRSHRKGFKAGALAYGLKTAKGEFIAIFDADFMPSPDFLKATLPPFQDKNVGMVQTRWGHVNANYSLLTRLQALFLDGHFMLEHTARYGSGAFFNFNGTAGVWRKETIASAGGWNARTLTEDLDLSYRAQLKGWRFVYLSDYVCPAELPVDIHAFRSQQRRWTKGAIQVARFVLKDIWRAKLPLHTKLEATVHLTANIGYLLTVVVSLLLLPSLLIRHHLMGIGLEVVELTAFLLTTVSITFFYAVSQREIYPNWKWKLKDIPALLSFGIGMCASNAVAVWEGFLGKETEFVRTPKYNIKTKTDQWVRKIYARTHPRFWWTQMALAVYSGVTLSVAAVQNNWASVPFIFLFTFGFSYVAGLSILHGKVR